MSEREEQEDILFTVRGYKISRTLFWTLVASIVLISVFVILDARIKDPKSISRLEKFIDKHVTEAPFLIAFASSFMFGAIDNFGLFFGIDAIESFIKQIYPNASPKTIAGLGNMYSDVLGAFVGASIANILTKMYAVHIDPAPVVDAVGIGLGTLFPVLLHIVGLI